jgi:hypothetical protein
VEKLHRFVEAGCSKFVLRPACAPAEVLSQIELYGTKILPSFSNVGLKSGAANQP